jgi:hypothetical protein
MGPVRLDPAVEAGFSGAAQDAAMPVPSGDAARSAAEIGRPRRSMLRIAVRVIRDASIAVVLMAMVPVGIVALHGPTFTRMGTYAGFVHRVAQRDERWRALTVPTDPAITPLEAGRAFSAIQPPKSGSGFTAIQPQAPVILPWRDATFGPGLFPDANAGSSHVPSSKGILQAVKRGLSPAELAFLELIAKAPAWRQFDILARAPAADFVGAQFQVPFGRDAYADLRPQDFKNLREMSAAAVSRAAYHMAIGQQDSAVTILRSIVSVGFAFIDNGTTSMDELMGDQLIGVGRVALRQYYELQRDPRALSATLANAARLNGHADLVTTAEAFRSSLIEVVNDPTRHRGERFEALGMLRASTCSNVRELLTGPGSDIRAATENARRTLVRYPSDRALIELMADLRAPKIPEGYSNPISDLASSAASVAGVAFHNPRFASCTRMLTLW